MPLNKETETEEFQNKITLKHLHKSHPNSNVFRFPIISDMPCMCVPVLEMDGGMKMPETMAIARYLAREYSK